MIDDIAKCFQDWNGGDDDSDAYDASKCEYLAFERVENKLSTRPDLHAFLLLNQLVPGNRDMICSASHDEIWLEVRPEELAKVATPEQIRDLVRCGVRYDRDNDSLCMFA